MERSIVDIMTEVENKLIGLSYSPGAIRHYQHHWNLFLKYYDNHYGTDLTKEIVDAFFYDSFGIRMDAPASSHTSHTRAGRRALQVLLDYQATGTIYRRQPRKEHIFKDCYEPIASEYLRRIETSKARSSFRQHRSKLEAFCEYLYNSGCTDFSGITKSMILGYWQTRSTLSKKTRQYDAYALRQFFDYLYEYGYTTVDNSVFVPFVMGSKQETIPAFYTPNELATLWHLWTGKAPLEKGIMPSFCLPSDMVCGSGISAILNYPI